MGKATTWSRGRSDYFKS